MLKWIVLAVVLLPLVALALAVRPVLTRLPRLRRAAVALQRRAAEAEALRDTAEALQLRAEGVSAPARHHPAATRRDSGQARLIDPRRSAAPARGGPLRSRRLRDG